MATDNAALCNRKSHVGILAEDLYSNIRYTKLWFHQEIKKLKAEISILHDNLEVGPGEDTTIETASDDHDVIEKLMKRLPEDKRPLLDGLDIKAKHKAGGDINIEWLKQFTGLCVDGISINVENVTAENITHRKHCLTGSCYDVQYEITFLVEENEPDKGYENHAADKGPKITDLNINIKNKLAYIDMKDALRHTQEQQELQQIFLILENYSQLKRQRLRTFHHFSEKYRELILASRDESTLTICNPKYPAIRFNIVWKILVTKEGQTGVIFDLMSGIPTGLHNQDKAGLLNKLRDKFCSLLKVVGIEKSIDVIINILAK